MISNQETSVRNYCLILVSGKLQKQISLKLMKIHRWLIFPDLFVSYWLANIFADNMICMKGCKKIMIVMLINWIQLNTVCVLTWNVYIFLDHDNISRHQRKTGLVASKLSWCNTDMATLSEIRLAKEESLTESNRCTIFRKGKTQNKGCIHEIELAIRTNSSNRLPISWPASMKCWWRSASPSTSGSSLSSALTLWLWHLQRKSRSSSTTTWTHFYTPRLPLSHSSCWVTSKPEWAAAAGIGGMWLESIL